MVMVMVLKKLQCNGNGNDYFQKYLAPFLVSTAAAFENSVFIYMEVIFR